MSILIDDSTRVIVQGITGRIGSVQTHWMLEYGTRVVGGVTPGKGGTTVEGVPVFDSVLEAVKETGANASVFFVPAAFVLDAFLETIDAGIKLIVVVPEHIPVRDVMKMRSYAVEKGVFALGPTTPGILSPGKGKMGIMPASLFAPGRVGIISRSGTLSYEFAGILSEVNVGQSTVVGMGADPVVLRNLADILELFERDTDTDAVIIVGEVGGEQEEKAAGFISRRMTKPVAAYIAGRQSPQGKRMGHAGAIVRGAAGTVDGKQKELRAAGVEILESPIHVADWARKNNLR
ncbi:MAG TPA: succinate--CoA ligase subunit alpha [Syntrophorhabdus sp.]|jgi:succinyl-CoA synthetase alpha subunit|nr:succinate--CoA ligase subunit alpha [Syntrophorhabdus sp.]MDI9559337.1 succinate--CoA ligase subunit alpha [Pseudomonadota bacterium]OPX95916.1 MAG: Succinyl-CoA ligase (ADP-forming) subunit alpha [Syntrophorhabdus sp. PtaB.Bin027]OQB74049.1 MAG: Succinyl-CoA ligase (ADP-forming) subunit alpha [Deltaproteobacteria bacterium ADurb.Bin135]MBP8744719.1 succinate--CoA ligase subunit alpha [Syntrophorhabdus sp.]